MENSAEKVGPVADIGFVEIGRPEIRSVHRRLVQSTLLPHKHQEQEENGDQDEEKDCGEDEEFCGSQSRKKRRTPGKTTPQNRGPKKQSKAKQAVTPKKILHSEEASPPIPNPRLDAKMTAEENSRTFAGMQIHPIFQCEEKDNGKDEDICGSQSRKRTRASGKTTPQKRGSKQSKEKQAVTPKKILHSEEASPPIPNLRLEAKMTAEENSRIFAGRQIHPFFSSRKAEKKSSEATPSVERGCSIERKDYGIDCNPIHVFERTGDDELSVDWKNWTFLDGTLINNGHVLQSTSSSVFEGSTKSLSLDDLPIVLRCFDSGISSKKPKDQGFIKQECNKDTTSTVSSVLADKKLMLDHLLNSTTEDGNLDTASGHTVSEAKPNIEHQSRFLQDRMQSYYLGCQNRPESCLWTYKYQPTMAMEVCGNFESVKFLSEWLHLWYERNSQNKVFAGGDRFQKKESSDNCSQSDSDYESLDGEDSLKNVLLVTGLSGSGKSAAIYACAAEHGFKVFEFSASVIRSGAVLKQMIGEALQSHQLNWAAVNSQGLRNNFIVKSSLSLPESTAVKDLSNEVVELIPLSDEDSKDNINGAGEFEYMVAETTGSQGEAKALILLEDVDVIFLEDRGFISSIQEIAETAKGPIILTSNSSNPVLPNNLDRLQVSFIRPSSKELLSHLYMICASEGVNIQPHLLERIIDCYHRDIRKSIMYLQFWCQGKGFRDKTQKYGSLLFDLDAGHRILPMIMPWSFPSQLSELVDKEISKSLFKMETSSCLQEASDSEFYEEEMQNGKDSQNYEYCYLEAKKAAMLSRNGSVYDHNEFAVQFDAAHECSDPSDTPIPLSGQKHRRRLDMVVSSDSEEEPINKEYSLAPNKNDDMLLPSHCPASQNCLSPLNELFCPTADDVDENHYLCSETADDVHTNGTCKSVNISYVPESSFVPETEIHGCELYPEMVSGGDAFASPEVSVNDFFQNVISVEANGFNSHTQTVEETSTVLGNTHNIFNLSHQEGEGSSHNEHIENITRGYSVMDECSRVDFNKSKFVEKPELRVSVDLVCESWKQLRLCHANLRHHVMSEKRGASQIIELVHKMSHLISDSDLLYSFCQPEDTLETPTFESEALDSFCWGGQQLQMASTTAQHGFCFLARDIANIGSLLGYESSLDIVSEMQASATNSVAMGKLMRPDVKKSSSYTKEILEPSLLGNNHMQERETKSRLFNVIQSVVPERLHLTLRGGSLSEYLSSLRCISRSETSRLSKGVGSTKRRRRGRVARHYLSSGSLMLSPEDITLLDRSKLPHADIQRC